MTDTIQIPSHVEIDVRRPDGTTETVRPAGKSMISELEFGLMKKATAAAGRGELLAYRNVMKTVEAPKPSAADLAEMAHIRHQNAVYRIAAGGEPCDQVGGAKDIDRTPANPQDY